MKFPIVPQDLTVLDDAALKQLLADIKAAHKAFNGTYTAEQSADAEAAADGVRRIKAEQAARTERQAAFQAAVDELEDLDEASDDDDDEDDEADAEADGDDEDADEDAAADEGTEDLADKPEPSKHLATVKASPRRPKQFGINGDKPVASPTTKPAPLGNVTEIVSAGEGPLSAGQNFQDWGHLVEEMTHVAKHMSPASQRRTVGVINGNFGADRQFTDDPIANVQLVNRMRSFAQDDWTPDELTAAFCAPPTPYYNLGCRNTDRRPVFGSMPTFAAPRGTVTIYPSPTLEDITGGYGIWDKDDDADPDAVKETCQTIDCADSDQFWLYGIYRCLTVKNLLQMTFPELVEAYLNRLAAAQARMAERQLLNAMGARATPVDAPPWDYDGPVNVVTGLLHLLTLHQESQRWDTMGGTMHAWIPRWVMHAMRISLARRRVTNGSGVRLPSEAEISALFSNVGFNVTWFIDTPTWAPTIPPVQAAGDLRLLPTTVPILIAPEGKFAVMDRGNLNIGVAPGNLYRDNTSNSKNEFTLFFESFEGLVDTDSCPSYIYSIPACWNGVQIADITAPECDGTTSGS